MLSYRRMIKEGDRIVKHATNVGACRPTVPSLHLESSCGSCDYFIFKAADIVEREKCKQPYKPDNCFADERECNHLFLVSLYKLVFCRNDESSEEAACPHHAL